MGTYMYKCSDCDNVFKIEATIREKEEGKSKKFICPKCQSKNISQEFSAINFIKNAFKSANKSGGCCSGGNVCDINRELNKKEKEGCETKNNNSGCCG